MAGRIGVYGGTFDPPHVGHLAVAAAAATTLGLDRVLWMPAARSPLRGRSDTPDQVRMEMVRVATAGDDRFALREDEVRRGGVSYTVDTLEDLSREAAGCDLHLIIGADQFREFDRWRSPERIAALATLVVVGREEGDGASSGPADPGVVHLPAVAPGVSSTAIRDAISRGDERWRGWVTAPVAAMIEEHGLYGFDPGRGS